VVELAEEFFKNIKKKENMLIICRSFVIKFRNQEKCNMSERNVKMSTIFKFKIDLIMSVCNNWIDVLFFFFFFEEN
jgi:hypothetical protein